MTKKLLLADDSITIQKVIGIIFATEDYDLQVCDDGDQAFDKALREYPDLVIADISMPGKDGFELCQAIKSEAGLAHTSVLLLPGTFDHFDESRAEAVGADGWISKPFESQALLEKVAQLLDAEPARLAAGEDVPAAASAADVAGEPVEEFSAAAETAVDEVVLGLDEVDELDVAATEPAVEEESADEIWDAVSFEEEDLQTSAGLSPAVETDLSAEFTAAESDLPLEEEAPLEMGADSAEAEVEYDLSEEDEEPLELTDAVEDAVDLEPPLELEEESIVAEEEELEPVVEEELVELVDEVVEETDYVAEPVADVPVVEPLDEALLEEDEEVLDLAEDDILEEEPAAEMVDLEPEPVVASFDEPLVAPEQEADEEDFVFTDEPLAVEEPEPVVEPVDEPFVATEQETVVEPEATEDQGFYFDSSEPEEEPLVEPAAALAASTVVEAAESSPAEQVERQLRELSDDELKEVVARVAGPTIEKLANEMLEQIVWEVVPDLAESMIRDEIRKIRQGAE